MAGALHVCHRHQGDKVAGMEAVRRRVEADVERHALFVEELAQLFLVRALGDEASLFQGVKYIHRTLSFIWVYDI